MIEIDVLPYSSELDSDIGRLFLTEGYERTPRYLSWIFRPPAGQALIAIARDAASDGQIVGVLGFVPWEVTASGESHSAYLAIDLVVDPAYRGRGIFKGLGKAALAAAASEGASFVWGFPNASAAHAWFNRFGWVRLGSPPMMVRPLRSGFLGRRIGLKSRAFDLPLMASPRNVEAQPIDRFGADADAFWAEASREFYCGAARDSQWLNWRIVDAPETSYRRVGAYSGGKLAAFVVTRRQQKRDLDILYVMEAMRLNPTHDGDLARLLRQELALAAADGTDVAFCWCPAAAPSRSAYRKSGFIGLPPRFRPSQTHFGVKPLTSLPPNFTDEKCWYISYLDSDAL